MKISNGLQNKMQIKKNKPIFSLSEFKKSLPQNNKRDTGEFLTSMLFMSVIFAIKKEDKKSVFLLQNIFFITNLKQPREWDVYERSFFSLCI